MEDFDLEIRIEHGEYFIRIHAGKDVGIIPVEEVCEWTRTNIWHGATVNYFLHLPYRLKKKLIKRFLASPSKEAEETYIPIKKKFEECYDTGLANHMNMLGWVKDIPKSEIEKLAKICMN